ncbi:MAG: pantoate--beta-alanine ligase, partial [Rhodothermales bacterium]|nr:pantoate--beta-alanine ligase [Rhodothermales bacterium]
RRHADGARCAGRRLGLVPTMGALHEGHLALVRHAQALADHVTVSIFVNPTQFGPGEDFERYPRTLEADLDALRGVGGVDCVFAPDVDEMYPGGSRLTAVEVAELDAHLCGAHRPGHFRGVATVVTKLFAACRPHVAVFGRKDAQQFVLLRRMARDLLLGVEVVGLETVREPDGLALSSRNRYLGEEARKQAVALSEAVHAAREAAEKGERRAQALVDLMRRTIGAAPMARLQYAEVVDAETLQPVETLRPGREVLAAVAAYFGDARLIDNAFIRAPE